MANIVCAEPAEVVAVVRLRHGVAGERRRVSHFVPIPGQGPVPEHLIAVCGEPMATVHAEVLDRIRGMPCEACLTRSLRPRYRALR